MHGHARIAAALAGCQPDTTPVMLHNFMMAAREAGMTMRQYRSDPKYTARAHIEAVERYGYDGILLDIDTATLACAAGVPVDFPDDEPALCRDALLNSIEDIDQLEPVDLAKHRGVQVWLEAACLLKRHFGGEIWIRGNCDQAPFSLACMVRGMQGFLLDITDESSHAYVRQLLDYCAGITCQFLSLMAGTGVDMLSNGDSSGGTSLISPRLYRELAQPYQKRIAAHAHSLGLPWALHVCGKTNAILEDLVQTGADALELDFKTDAKLARDILEDRATFIGNIDPSGVLALGTPDLVETETRKLMETFSGTPRFILNAGCAIPAETPSANLAAMIRVAREYRAP